MSQPFKPGALLKIASRTTRFSRDPKTGRSLEQKDYVMEQGMLVEVIRKESTNSEFYLVWVPELKIFIYEFSLKEQDA